MNRDKLAAAVAEAERFSIPGFNGELMNDNFPREQGAIRRASMDLTRPLADLRRPQS